MPTKMVDVILPSSSLPGNLKYPNVFCGSDEHMPMLIAGWLLLAFGALAGISWNFNKLHSQIRS